MTKRHEIGILNSLLDDYRGAINHQDDFGAEEIRAKIVRVANRLIALQIRDL